MNVDTKLSLLMKSLTKFYENIEYIEEMKSIVEQNNVLSLRILDWFITNYSKKYRTIINVDDNKNVDVYMNYKLMLKSFSKRQFDPFCRKNKIFFYYTEDAQKYVETSCGQLCFFRWCFENNILNYVKEHFDIIEEDMKNSLKVQKKCNDKNIKKRQPLSINAGRSISKLNMKYVLKFD